MHSIEDINTNNAACTGQYSSSGQACTNYVSTFGAPGVYLKSPRVPQWKVTSNNTDHYVHEVNQSVLQEYLFRLQDKAEAEQLADLLNALCHA